MGERRGGGVRDQLKPCFSVLAGEYGKFFSEALASVSKRVSRYTGWSDRTRLILQALVYDIRKMPESDARSVSQT